MNRKRDLENLSKLYESFSEDEQSSAFGQEMADEAEDQNPVQNYEDEEVKFQVGDKVKVNAGRSLNDLRSGRYGAQDMYMSGTIAYIDDDNVQIDTDHGTMEVDINSIEHDEEAEDLGPNQQPESWGDEAMGDEQPGETSMRFSQDTPDDPASGGSPNIDDPDEEEYDDPYYNREEDLRSRGIDPDAEDPDADEKGKEERNSHDEDAEFMNHMLMRRARQKQREDMESGVHKGKAITATDRLARKVSKNLKNDSISDVTKGNSKIPTLKNAPKKDRPTYNPDLVSYEDEEMSLEDAIKVIRQHIEAKAKYGDDYDIEDETLNFGDREKAMKVWVKNFHKKDEDELGQAMAYKKITGNEVKKESFNSHGDRDMSLLAEKYLNIKNHE